MTESGFGGEEGPAGGAPGGGSGAEEGQLDGVDGLGEDIGESVDPSPDQRAQRREFEDSRPYRPLQETSTTMSNTIHKTDHDLKMLVTDELDYTPSVVADRIGVSVHNGAVTLSGEVDTYLDRQAVIQAVLRIRGVTAVADEITVQATEGGAQQDSDIARHASIALEHAVGLPVGAIKASVRQSEITLNGAVDWHYQRERAARLVAGLRGVRHVHNLITLNPQPGSAQSIKAHIVAAISRNAQLDASHIQVHVQGREVTLTGTVASWAERRQAERVAWYSLGVTTVHNHIDVAA